MSQRILNLCGECERDFYSVRAFDLHRVGKHAYAASAEQPDGRRCLSDEEMLDKGMRLDAHGRWRGQAAANPWFAQLAKGPTAAAA
jgi:hypothetical protein